MRYWLRRIEHTVDWIIWPALVVLLLIIILELFFHELAQNYAQLINGADIVIIALFCLDLSFKWYHTRRIKPFLKHYWPDIIAVFPFFLLFRFLSGFSELFSTVAEVGGTTQQIVHEGLEVEKEGAKVVREVEAGIKEGSRLQRVSRATRFQRFLRPVLRAPRFLKATHFYEKPE